MKPIHTTNEKGQTLIIVAVALTVLLMFVALAIDVGNMYQVRRQMQNAADAGALAGARELCFGDPSQAEARAREYAALNGADPAQSSVEISGGRVDVVARVPADMYVADIMGISTVDVGAHAAAVCGSAESGCGLWPLAFSRQAWDRLVAENRCQSGKSFYVWTGNNDNQKPDCNICECDVDGDRKDDIIADTLSRAWLDFSAVVSDLSPDVPCLPRNSSGCGSKELDCWLKYDTHAEIVLPACIAGINGVRDMAKEGVDYRKTMGHILRVPLYSSVGCEGPRAQCYEKIKEKDGVIRNYWVTAFGCVISEGWEQQFELKYKDNPNKKCWKDKVIKVRMYCGDDCFTDCGSTSGGEISPGGVGAVSLIE